MRLPRVRGADAIGRMQMDARGSRLCLEWAGSVHTGTCDFAVEEAPIIHYAVIPIPAIAGSATASPHFGENRILNTQSNAHRVKAVRAMVSEAVSLHSACAEPLSCEPELRGLLDRYDVALKETSRRMRELGVVKACSACATEGHGSCCFPGIEEGYDSVLLLINLLLGCCLPDKEEVSGSCFFVGEYGCKLMARYYFCIHYFCPELERNLGADGVRSLLSTVGDELQAGWQLEQFLRQWLKQKGMV